MYGLGITLAIFDTLEMRPYSQDGGLVCCCYDYPVEVRLQNCVVHCVLCLIGCVMSDVCHAEQEYLFITFSGKPGKSQ